MRSATMEQEAATYFLSGQEPIGQVPKQIDLDIQMTPLLFLVLYIQCFAGFCPERGAALVIRPDDQAFLESRPEFLAFLKSRPNVLCEGGSLYSRYFVGLTA
jgi:hypothetical protein